MRAVCCISFAWLDWRVIEHMDSSDIGIGILKCECAVRLPCYSSAAIPLDATAKAILPTERILDRTVSSRKVLP